jgi:hypothetical protein
MLLHYKGSTLSLQTPEWRNHGKPGCDFSRAFRHLFFTTIPPGPAL